MTGPVLRILGTRGIPNRHGGFESFAEQLSPFLLARGWRVTVYCHEEGDGEPWESEWQGVRRVHIPVRQSGPRGTIVFDWRCTKHALREQGLVLVLGYNTAVFSLAFRRRGVANLLNMDGIEWKRAKWSLPAKAWFFANERLGARLATHLIADHPVIAERLSRLAPARKITMIPYSAPVTHQSTTSLLAAFGIESRQYALIVARPEPENSILGMVRAWRGQARPVRLVVLGDYRAGAYARHVVQAADADVVFAGPIYDRETVAALRTHCVLYLHGHRVGGTNPSLVESLACGAAIVAHDNPYNRWVAGTAGAYFTDETACAGLLDRLLAPDAAALLEEMRAAARLRYCADFTPERVLGSYEALLRSHADGRTVDAQR